MIKVNNVINKYFLQKIKDTNYYNLFFKEMQIYYKSNEETQKIF